MGKFVKFDRNKNKVFSNPAITITKIGIINFNSGISREYIKGKNYVLLYYDKTDKRIGFEFLSKKSAKGFKINKFKKSNVGNIYGRAFLRYYNIPCVKTKRYSVEIDNETKFVFINIGGKG